VELRLGTVGTLLRGVATGASLVGTGGRLPGLSVPVSVELVGKDVVLPRTAEEAKSGRAGTGGGRFRLAGTGGASMSGAVGVFIGAFGAGRDTAGPDINPTTHRKATMTHSTSLAVMFSQSLVWCKTSSLLSQSLGRN